MTHRSRTLLSETGILFGRSFWPFFAIVIIMGAMLWGPWISLAITAVAVTVALRLF